MQFKDFSSFHNIRKNFQYQRRAWEFFKVVRTLAVNSNDTVEIERLSIISNQELELYINRVREHMDITKDEFRTFVKMLGSWLNG